MSDPDESTIDVVRKATRELARNVRLRVLASEGQARRIPVGVRQGVRPGRMARRPHPRASTAGWGSASRNPA